MSDADYYVEIRATAKTTAGKTVGLLDEVHPDLWEDRCVLNQMILHTLHSVADKQNDTVKDDTLVVTKLRRLPEFEGQRRKITDPYPRDEL